MKTSVSLQQAYKDFLRTLAIFKDPERLQRLNTDLSVKGKPPISGLPSHILDALGQENAMPPFFGSVTNEELLKAHMRLNLTSTKQPRILSGIRVLNPKRFKYGSKEEAGRYASYQNVLGGLGEALRQSWNEPLSCTLQEIVPHFCKSNDLPNPWNMERIRQTFGMYGPVPHALEQFARWRWPVRHLAQREVDILDDHRPSEKISMEMVKWPFDSFLLMFPDKTWCFFGKVRHGNRLDHSCYRALAKVCRISEQTIPQLKEWAYTDEHRTESAYLFIAGDPTGGTCVYNAGQELSGKDILDNLISEDSAVHPALATSLSRSPKGGLSANQFATRILRTFKAAILMVSRPEYVEGGIGEEGVERTAPTHLPAGVFRPSYIRYPKRNRVAPTHKGDGVPGYKLAEHTRCGHWKLQWYGPGHTKHKIIWIDPYIAGTPTGSEMVEAAAELSKRQ